MQELEVGAGAVEENEHLAAGGLSAQLPAHKPAEAIEGFAHVTAALVEKVAVLGSEAKHQ